MAELPPPIDADSFEAHARFVRSLARELARDSDEADEVVARTLAAAVEQRPRDGATLRGWFARVSRRVVSRLRRDEARRDVRERAAARDERSDAATSDPASIAARAELIERVAAAFAALDEPYRTTLYRRFYDDRTPSQIAARDGVPVETVKTRLRRGLQRLRERLDLEHGGKREGWRALAIALASKGGGVVAITKLKVAAVAAAVVLLGGALTWELVPWRAHRGDANAAERTVELSAAAAPDRTASPKHAEELDAAQAAKRTDESLLFASGIVVDPAGGPIAGVRIVPSLVIQQFDGQWIATNLELTRVEHDFLATTSDDGRFRIVRAPRNIAGLFFFKPGLVVGEWFELSAKHDENSDHRVVLAPAPRVHGRVVDTSDRPIAFATISVHPFESKGSTIVAAAAEGSPRCFRSLPWASHMTSTAEDGAFGVDCVNEIPCRLWVDASGYGRFPDQRKLVERDTEVRIVLRRETAVLVDVRDAKTKAPIPNARALSFDVLGARAEELHLPYEEWLGRQWDGNRKSPPGRLVIWCERHASELKAPGSSRALKVVVFAEGYRPEERSFTLKKDEEPPHETIDLEPREPIAALAGSVTGTDEATIELRFDKPFSNPDIQNSPALASLHVGTDGRFAFHDLPPATYRLSATAPLRAPVWLDVTAPRDDLSIRFTPSASLVARVVDSTGAPVAGQIVLLQSIDAQRAWCATTGPDGSARLEGLPTGTFDALSHMPIRGQSTDTPPRTTRSDNFFVDERITLVAGENGPIELRSLERRSVTLHFEYSDGAPVFDAKLTRLSGDRGPVNWSYHEEERMWALDLKTDADGFVDVDLYPGSYMSFVLVSAVQSLVRFTVPRRGEDAIEVKLGTAGRFGIVRGRVVSIPGDRPLAGWSVSAGVDQPDPSSSVSTASVTTDADGRFQLDRCPIGPLRVVARDPTKDDVDHMVSEVVSFVSMRLALARDQASDLTIPVPDADTLATTSLELDLTSSDDGRPVPRVHVLVTGTIGAAEYGLLRVGAPTDANGHFTQRFLACERYHVLLFPPRESASKPSLWKMRELDVVPQDGVARASVVLERNGEH